MKLLFKSKTILYWIQRTYIFKVDFLYCPSISELICVVRMPLHPALDMKPFLNNNHTQGQNFAKKAP